MSLLAKMGKPIGFLAAILTIIQGLIWVILAILGLLVYSCSIDTSGPIITPPGEEMITEADTFIQTMLHLYFLDSSCNYKFYNVTPIIPNLMTPSDVQIWVIVNLVFNLLWIASAVYYLVELHKSNGKGFGVFGWLGVTCLVLILDLATAIAFGLDYNTMLNSLVDLPGFEPLSTVLFMVPMFLTTLAMRGYILWILNDGLVVFIIFSLFRQNKEKEGNSRDLSRQASFVNPTVNAMYPDDDDSSYHRPTQPRNAWDPAHVEPSTYPYSAQHTPVQRQPSGYYDQTQRPPGQYNSNYDQPQRPPGAYTYGSPQDQPPQRPIVLADPPKGRSQPSGQYVPPPKHIPSPDYSPPLSQREILPIRPVLRKPPGKIGQIGRTVF